MFQIKDKTYPDGTKSTATVPVTVIAPNVPDVIYVPKGDKVPDPSTVVTNSNDIKDKIPDTTYTWKTTPDTPNTKVVINYKANNPGTPDTPVTPPVDPGDNPATPVTQPVKPEQKHAGEGEYHGCLQGIMNPLLQQHSAAADVLHAFRHRRQDGDSQRSGEDTG